MRELGGQNSFLLISDAKMNASSPAKKPMLAFIGGGQMAAALMGGLIRSGWPSSRIIAVEPNDVQRERLEATLRVKAEAEPGSQLTDVDIIIWAVKPQILEQVIRHALPHLRGSLHISVAAGVKTEAVAGWAQSRRVARVMPNTAALVGAGVSGLYALDEVNAIDRAVIEQILAPTGYCFWVESDDKLDAVTSVSGSGPAYVFHFMEAFQTAAENVGFEGTAARDLVIKIVAGAVEQAKRSDTSFATLRQNVTSKRGTTEAALAVLYAARTAEALSDAVLAAKSRASELSRELVASPSSSRT